jgi:hypothetical protein
LYFLYDGKSNGEFVPDAIRELVGYLHTLLHAAPNSTLIAGNGVFGVSDINEDHPYIQYYTGSVNLPLYDFRASRQTPIDTNTHPASISVSVYISY